MRHGYKSAIIGFGMIFFLAGPLGAYGLEIRQTEGQSVVLRAGLTSWQRLETGDILRPGDRIVTGEGAVLQLETSAGVLEMSESTDLMVRALPVQENADGALTLELSAGQIRADWNAANAFPLEIQTPGSLIRAENGFLSTWIYSLVGKSYTRLDVFRGEAELQEKGKESSLRLEAGQHVTSGLNTDYGPRRNESIQGFDAFQIAPEPSAAGAAPVMQKTPPAEAIRG